MFNQLKDIIIRYQQQEGFNKQLIKEQILFYTTANILLEKEQQELLLLLE